MTCQFFLGVFSLTFILVGVASESSIAASSPPADIASTTSLFKTITILLFTMIVAIGCILLVRRFSPQSVQHGNMRVLAAMSLGGRERLLLVSVGDKQVLLGVSPGRVTHIETFLDPVVIPEAPPKDLATTFKQLLKKNNFNKGEKSNTAKNDD